jgi:hypothetical protein
VIDALAAVFAELADLRTRMDAVEARTAPTPLCRKDWDALARILPVLGATFGAEFFLAREAVEHHAPGLRLVLEDMTARRLGRLLRRADGVEVCGYVARASGMEAGAVLWSVLAGRTPESHW